jgi:hypothetical protein
MRLLLSKKSSLLLALLLSVLLWPGCGTPPPSPSRLSTSYGIARDGFLHYRLPAGWFDVTADSQAHGNAIWLLRSDYAATITVNEIRIDASARDEISRQGLAQLARLTMFLSTNNKGALLQRPPEDFVVRGHQCCSYELLMPANGDILRTILLDSGQKIYAVAALRTAGAKDEAELRAVQMEFVEGLRW